MRNLPVLLLESVSLFFLLDFSPQLSVDAVFSASALILQAVLDDTRHVSEQTERGKRCRPVSVDTNAVYELCCVLIAMLGCKMKIVHRRIGVSRYLFSVEIDFSELVLGVVIAVFGGYLKAADALSPFMVSSRLSKVCLNAPASSSRFSGNTTQQSVYAFSICSFKAQLQSSME